MIALLLSVALTASFAPDPGSKPIQPPERAKAETDGYTIQEIEYARSALPMPGWNLLSATRNLIVFSKGKPGFPNATLWIRGEHYPLSAGNPLGTGESFVTLYDVDCAGGRTRTLSSTVYSGAKMQGAIIAASDKIGEWAPLPPGGFTDLGAQTVCNKPVALNKESAKVPGEAGGAISTPSNGKLPPAVKAPY